MGTGHALRIDHMSARDLALLSLDRIDLPGWPRDAFELDADHHRATSSTKSRRSDPRDIELGARIETATIKNLLWINHLVIHFAERPLKKIDPRIRKIIGIAMAQILFLDRIPHSAAVDEAVKQARRFGRTSAAGFVNAILRRAARGPLPDLPSAEDNPREHARLALSHPPELFDRIVELIGTNDALRMCQHNNRRPPTILRLAQNISPDDLKVDGVTITPHERAGMVVIHPTPHARLTEWSTSGIAQAQDPTSAAVAELCAVRPGMRILDRCCGLGTKTLQLREILGESGQIIAIDPDARRIDTLRRLIEQRGYSNIHVVQGSRLADGSELTTPGSFDRILIDAPCSNSGVLARRSAARYFQSNEALASLETLQSEILTDTLPALAPNGLLIYSTCSIWPEENERLIKRFLEAHSRLALRTERTTLPSFESENPGHYHDGGYVAVLRHSNSGNCF